MKIKKYTIRENKTVEDALKIIDKNGEKTCFIIDVNKKLLGSLTDGDVRRSLYKRRVVQHRQQRASAHLGSRLADHARSS